jgi:hypothetical protein
VLKVPGVVSLVATNERRLAEGLVKHVLPGRSPKEYDEILSLRDKGSEVDSSWSHLLTDDNVELLMATMESHEREEFQQEIEKCRKKDKASATASTSAGPSSATGGAASSSPAAPLASEGASSSGAVVICEAAAAPKKVTTTIVADPHLNIEDARLLMPHIDGATLNHVSLWHVRWKATYPREEFPRSISKSYGTDVSSDAALRFVPHTRWGVAHRLARRSVPL